MTKVGETRSAAKDVRPPGPAKRATPAAGSAGMPWSEISHDISILGIPQAEITPKVRDAIITLMAEVERLRRELDTVKTRLRSVETEADRDPLVPVLNRRAFVRELTRVIAYVNRYGTDASLVYLDLDNFKALNDNHGHAAGDAALAHVARVLVDNTRHSDIVGRLGGDEFGVILPHAGPDIALKKAEQLAETISCKALVYEGEEILLSIAPGTTSFAPGEDPSEALKRADRAMYEQKRAGRNT